MTKITKESILATLYGGWNGTSRNRTPFTQWNATEGFFDLWRIHKEEIKSLGFSLFKSPQKGWVVTLFGVHEGKYDSYKKANPSNEIDSELLDMANDYHQSCIRQGMYELNEIIKSFLIENKDINKLEARKAFKKIHSESR